MDPATIAALDRVNRDFYASRAAQWSITRAGPWPGWRRLLPALRAIAGAPGARPLRILDVGCGNGRLATWLAHELALPHRYLGLDRSVPLLVLAKLAARTPAHGRGWVATDLVASYGTLPCPDAAFDAVVVTALFHHLPSHALRRVLIGELARVTRPGGLVALSHWQLAADPRTAGRRLPWSLVPGLDPARLESGDTLLRWGDGDGAPQNDGAPACRYCHHVDEGEAAALERGLGLTVVASFRSDGRSGDANLYRVLARGAGLVAGA